MSNIECFLCGEFGHYCNQCHELKAKAGNQMLMNALEIGELDSAVYTWFMFLNSSSKYGRLKWIFLVGWTTTTMLGSDVLQLACIVDLSLIPFLDNLWTTDGFYNKDLVERLATMAPPTESQRNISARRKDGWYSNCDGDSDAARWIFPEEVGSISITWCN